LHGGPVEKFAEDRSSSCEIARAALSFVLLGLFCGVAAWAFIRLLVFMEDGFPKLPGNDYTQNIVGTPIIGLMMVGLTRVFGHSCLSYSRSSIRRRRSCFSPCCSC